MCFYREPSCLTSVFLLASITMTLILSAVPFVTAQEFGVSDIVLEKIVVKARKREELIQSTPIAVTHFGSKQIEALKVTDLESLTVGIPNVSLDDIGTSGGGIGNFSIRGIGINSSIPSVDPTVGVFVDGVYLGQTNSVMFDTFDLESIEVIRGPQGVLFGRNVIGGAILVNTKKPTDSFDASFRTRFEGGGESLNSYYMASLGGPLGNNVAAKITAYTNQDQGWFKNLRTGKSFGEADVRMLRPVLTWNPTENLDFVFRYQYESIDGDGPAAQSHSTQRPSGLPNFSRDSHDFSIDQEGFRKVKNHFLSVQTDWDVDLGNGTITNIFGWRTSDTQFGLDLDSSPLDLITAMGWNDAEQLSNELRYSGELSENLQAVTGIYYFRNRIRYYETRVLLEDVIKKSDLPDGATISQSGGGKYEVDTLGVFLSLDYYITDKTALIAGGRYTYEKRKADIALIRTSTPTDPIPPCNIVDGPSCDFDFSGNDSWNSLSPKLGATYSAGDNIKFYGHWTRAFRSGGYNLRNLSLEESPGPYDEERIDSFETGIKFSDYRSRLNIAGFYHLIDDMQREINFPIAGVGIAQIIRNTADVRTFGFEVEGTFAVTENLLFLGSAGYVDPEYTKVMYDLNRDGVVDNEDETLELPRAAKWTYSIGSILETAIANWGQMISRVTYSYRDKSYFTDDNLGYILEQKILDAGIDVSPWNGRFSVGIYGKNLLNQVKHGGDTLLPQVLGSPPLSAPLGGTFSPLSKGRTFGVEFTWRFGGYKKSQTL